MGKEELSKICMIAVEDAHRATAGSHPLSELIRNCILEKAKFRVLAYTDCKLDKVGQLQLIVMNLQIDLIRSLSSIREEISPIFASPRMYKFEITISDDIQHVGNELLKVMEPIALLLYESGTFPTADIKKIANFSISYLQKKIENEGSHLAEIYCDFFELLSAYDILMCDGLTAFKSTLQALSAQSRTIDEIIQSSEILREVCFLPEHSTSHHLQCHKLDMLITLLTRVSTYYKQQKSTVMVLCRERDPGFVNSLFASLKARLSGADFRFAFFLNKKNPNHQEVILENSMKNKLCNVIIVPCGSDAVKIDVGYVDSIICMDEGLCALRYTGTIKVRLEGNLSALCSSGYEMNICSFLAVDGTVDCVQTDHIKGLQLCDDVLPMLPFDVIPEIVEYWAQNIDDSGLTMIQRLDFHERLTSSCPLDKLNLIENKRSLLNHCVKETFMWQDRLQRFTLLGHSISSSNLTNIFGRDSEILAEQVLRLQNMQKLKWMDEDSQSSKPDDDTKLMELHLKDNKNPKIECCEKPLSQKRSAKVSSSKCVPTKVSRLNRIDSASFTLLSMLKTELTAKDFVNRVKEHTGYRERQERIGEIIQKLNNLIRL